MGNAAKQLLQWDKQYLWHPFTPMQDWRENDQLIIERGDGAYLFDTEGNKYIDGVSSLWVNVHGHRKKEIDAAVKKQLGKIAHSTFLGLSNPPAIELAKKLVEIAPKGLNKVFFSDNGSTAVEVALKIAFQYWRQMENSNSKTKFLTLKNAYHGDTLGSVSVGGVDLFHRIYSPLLFKAFKADPDLIEVEKVMRKHHSKIAAMVVEPMVQAAAGILLQPKGFLKGIRKLCDQYNILLICDEVAAGFGRTGKMFACGHEKISPDIMCIAKGITGGYLPLAATLTTDKIYRAFLGKPEENKTFFHGHTYTGNPLACAAALASLELFKKERTLLKMIIIINKLKTGLKRFNQLDHVGEIRQLGLMVGIELTGFQPKERIGQRVVLEARRRGAILRPLGNVIVLMPPLSIKPTELDQLLNITFESIKAATS